MHACMLPLHRRDELPGPAWPRTPFFPDPTVCVCAIISVKSIDLSGWIDPHGTNHEPPTWTIHLQRQSFIYSSACLLLVFSLIAWTQIIQDYTQYR
jgi:hypothetical protein